MNPKITSRIHQIGIHTFECKIDHLKKYEYEYLRSVLNDRKNYLQSTKYTNVYITEPQKGIRIKLTKSRFHELIIIVNPWILLHGTPDYSKIMISFEQQEFENALDSALRYYFGNNYGLERFRLSRADCTCDIYLSENVTREYIDLIRRSNKSRQKRLCYSGDVKLYNPFFYKIGDPDFYTFSAYDKIYDLINRMHLPENPGHGLLRPEPAFGNREICKLRKNIASDKITDLIEFYLHNARCLIEKYVKYHFDPGNYYSYNSAEQIIEKEITIKKVRKKVKEYLCKADVSYDYDEYIAGIGAITDTYEIKRTIRRNLSRLKINPVTIRTGSQYLPGLCTILDNASEHDCL